MTNQDDKRTIEFILNLINADVIGYFIANNTIDIGLGIIETPYGLISLEMIKDIESNPEHYRKLI